MKRMGIKTMFNHIWGNIFLYCWEHNIDFHEVYCSLVNIEWQKYKEQCEFLNIPMRYKRNCSANKLVGSTLEIDVNVLVSYFNIPIQEIFNPSNYAERLVKFLKAIKEECSFQDIDYEFYHVDNRIDFNVTYNVGSIFAGELSVEYTFSKYFDKEKLRFCYSVDAELQPIQFRLLRTDISDGAAYMAFHSLDRTLTYKTICLYDGTDDDIADYFNKEMKYEDFPEYKYEKEIVENRECNFQTQEIISEKSIDDYKIIDFKNIIVKSSIKKCDNPDHVTKIVNGIFFILLNKTGEIKMKIVPMVYCKNCNMYFMYDYEYDALKMEGKPLCRIHDRIQKNKAGEIFSQLSTESIFKICGYTVDANEGMSSQARKKLLEFLINRKIVTVLQTLNFLQWLINSRKNNVNMYNAVKKWEDDFNYINEKYNSAEHVIPV